MNIVNIKIMRNEDKKSES